MGWSRPILTDSGGYQVFSLATLRRIREDGAEFRSHLDGALHVLTPELATDIQAQLGSDIAMVLDECIATPATRMMPRATRWSDRYGGHAARHERLSQLRNSPGAVAVINPGQAQFGIVQGATFPDLRSESVAGDDRDRIRRVCDRRPQRGGGARGDVRGRRAHGAAASGRTAALPHGQRHAGRSIRVRRAGHRHVRLRAADPQRAQRAVPDERGRCRSRTRSSRKIRRRPIRTAAAIRAGTSRAPTSGTSTWPAR